jgi:flagellar assembly factor FliW
MSPNATLSETGVAEIHFAAGLPGFPHAHRFSLTSWGGDDSPFLLMSSSDDPDAGFVLISPYVFRPDYTFDLDDMLAERIGLAGGDDAVVLCIVTLYDRPEDATVNLLGPIVVNTANGEACQAVQNDRSYEVRAPLAPAA